MSFNKIILVGNLGRDPELRQTPSGGSVCDFSLATNEKRKGSDGEFEDVTTWFRVTLWGKQAELAAEHLTKGRQVYIEGKLRMETWEDKDGNKRQSLEVNGSDMQFIGGRALADEGEAEEAAPAAASAGKGKGKTAGKAATGNDDDIPF